MVATTLGSLAAAVDECIAGFGSRILNNWHPRLRYKDATYEEDLGRVTITGTGAAAIIEQLQATLGLAATHAGIEALAAAASGATIQVLRNDAPFIDLKSGESATATYSTLRASPVHADDKIDILATINKRAFLDGSGADQYTHCFVSGSQLRRFLARDLSTIATLWPPTADGQPANSVATIHTPSDVTFDGWLLRIGSNLAVQPTLRPGIEARAARFQHHGASIATRGIDLAGLTPAHLARYSETSEEPKELHTHLARVALVLLSDIARCSSGETTVVFRSGNLHASVTVPEGPVPVYPSEVVKLCDWVYQPPAEIDSADPFHDRLAVAQTVLARDLQPVQAERRFAFLVNDERRLLDETMESWKSYVADKIDAHTSRRIELEKEVSSTVEEFGERTSSMVADLATAMAGVVAALITSFLGAAFSTKFNADIFRIGLGAYLVYIVIFPAIAGLAVYRSRQAASESDLEARIGTFSGALGRDTVNEVIGDRVEDAKGRFSSALQWSVLAYGIVALAGVIALFMVPDIVSNEACTQAATTATPAVPPELAVPPEPAVPPVCR